MILITGKTYDALKYLAQVVLPALATLYLGVAGIWGLPSAQEVVGTIVAIDAFLGVVLQLSSSAYAKSDERFDGSVNVLEQTDEVGSFSLHLPLSAEDVLNSDQLVLKVNKGLPVPLTKDPGKPHPVQ